jgi:hypothetical protein
MESAFAAKRRCSLILGWEGDAASMQCLAATGGNLSIQTYQGVEL